MTAFDRLSPALGFGGRPLDTVLRTFREDVRLVASDETLDELERVMEYDRLPEQHLRHEAARSESYTRPYARRAAPKRGPTDR